MPYTGLENKTDGELIAMCELSEAPLLVEMAKRLTVAMDMIDSVDPREFI